MTYSEEEKEICEFLISQFQENINIRFYFLLIASRLEIENKSNQQDIDIRTYFLMIATRIEIVNKLLNTSKNIKDPVKLPTRKTTRKRKRKKY